MKSYLDLLKLNTNGTGLNFRASTFATTAATTYDENPEVEHVKEPKFGTTEEFIPGISKTEDDDVIEHYVRNPVQEEQQNQSMMKQCADILANIPILIKTYERFQSQIKTSIYEIECNSRSIINTCESKLSKAKAGQEDESFDPKFYNETYKSLVEAKKVIESLQNSMSMGLQCAMPNFNLKRVITYESKTEQIIQPTITKYQKLLATLSDDLYVLLGTQIPESEA